VGVVEKVKEVQKGDNKGGKLTLGSGDWEQKSQVKHSLCRFVKYKKGRKKKGGGSQKKHTRTTWMALGGTKTQGMSLPLEG